MKLTFLSDSQPLWVPGYMGWHAGLMYCSMEGNHSSSTCPLLSVFLLINALCCSHQLICHSIIPNPQYCTKVAYHCPWFTYNPLVSVTLCSLTANICHGRTRNHWQDALDCSHCSELYNLFKIVRLVIFHLITILYLPAAMNRFLFSFS